jgi:hypothetical protein
VTIYVRKTDFAAYNYLELWSQLAGSIGKYGMEERYWLDVVLAGWTRFSSLAPDSSIAELSIHRN